MDLVRSGNQSSPLAGGMTLRGVVPYLVTPIRADGRPDPGALRTITAQAVAAGVQGLVPLGSSGEFPYIGDKDRAVVLRAVVDEAGGATPILPGVGGFSVEQAVAQARAAVDAGADGVLCIILAFGRLSDDEILRYVEGVVSAVDVPVGLYHNPELCGVSFSDRVVKAALVDGGASFVKDASGHLDNLSRWVDLVGGKAEIFSSTAVSPTAAMLLGASGWMSGPATAFPAASVRVFELCQEGRWRDALIVERALEPALDLFRRLGPTRGAKALVTASGIPAGPPVPPLAPLDPQEMEWSASCVAEVQRRIDALPDWSSPGHD